MIKKIGCVILLALFAFSCGNGNSGDTYFPTGKLDDSFNPPFGFVTFSGSVDSSEVAVETAVQPDGKIVVMGYTGDGSKNNILLLRYTTQGTLDPDFGSGGIVMYDGGGTDHKGLGLALSADGAILVAGYIRYETGRDILVLKYNADGSLEKSYTYSSEGQFTDIGFGVAVQSDGKIVVVGEHSGGANQDVILLRLNPDLEPDASFGSGGIVTYNGSGNEKDKGFAVAVQDDGKIVVSGAHVADGKEKEDVLALRYGPDGVLDLDFGNNGVFSYSYAGDNSDYGNSVQIQSDGKIVVAGSGDDGQGFKILLLRLNPDGTLDPGFGTGGAVVYGSQSGIFDYAFGVAIQDDGKILVAGASDNGLNDDAIVLRYESDGALDPGFAENGVYAFTGLSGGEKRAHGVALQPDRRIVVAGYSIDAGNQSVLLFRLN